MKHLLFLVSFILTGILTFGQVQYEVTIEGPDKILTGVLNRDIVQKDSAFKWFTQNQQGYVPNADAVNKMKSRSSNLHFIVFGGTWCDDTKLILPRFYALADAASIPAANISLIGVNRSKKTLGHLSESLNVTNVPTIIVLQDGKEIGRVVEYGKTGLWDKELGELVK
jgi:thiol-disulfide isomerase/thioredoxin